MLYGLDTVHGLALCRIVAVHEKQLIYVVPQDHMTQAAQGCHLEFNASRADKTCNPPDHPPQVLSIDPFMIKIETGFQLIQCNQSLDFSYILISPDTRVV